MPKDSNTRTLDLCRPRLDLRPAPREFLVLRVTRREIETLDVGPALAALEVLSADAHSARAAKGRLALVVEPDMAPAAGDADDAPLAAYLRRIDAAWPYWFWFLNQVDDSILSLVRSLAGSRRIGPETVRMEGRDCERVMNHCCAAVKQLCERFGFPRAEYVFTSLEACRLVLFSIIPEGSRG